MVVMMRRSGGQSSETHLNRVACRCDLVLSDLSAPILNTKSLCPRTSSAPASMCPIAQIC